MTTLPDQKK